MSPKADLAVFIPTYNEEPNVRRAIESVLGWAAQVFVVDSFSKDRTVEIARSCPQVEVHQHAFENYSKQWNWALDNLPIRATWVMILAADEAVPPQTREEIERALASAPAEVAAFQMWWKLIFMGRWLKHMSGRAYNVRIWRRGRSRFEDRAVNEHAIVDGQVRRIEEPLIHDDRKGISAWVWRHNRYSTMEAQEHVKSIGTVRAQPSTTVRLGGKEAFRRFLKDRVWPLVPFKPLAYFLYLYVLRLGFLDGWQGLAYARLRWFYYYLIELKKREHALTGEVSSPDVMG